MNKEALQKIESLLTESATTRAWGAIEIDIKDGRVTLIRQTKQFKVEDTPAYANRNR